MHSTIRGWWAWILIPQAVCGGIAGTTMLFYGFNTATTLGFALLVAAVVAVVSIFIAIMYDRPAGVAVASAMLAAILALFCGISGAFGFALLLSALSGTLFKLAAMIAAKE